MIQENADLVTREHQLQEQVGKAGNSLEAIDDILAELECILEYREAMLAEYRVSVAKYREAVVRSQNES